MFSTVIFATIFAGLLLITVVLWALFLRLGLRWAKVPDVTRRQVVFTTVISHILGIVILILFLFASPSSNSQEIVIGILELALSIGVPCAVIGIVFKVKFIRAFQAWLPTLLTAVFAWAIVLLVFRPFLYEAFSASANAMAPTLLGQCWKGTCPTCGATNYCSPLERRFGRNQPMLMICDNFHTAKSMEQHKQIYPSDRFLVAKFLNPRRWDLVVFQSPNDPTTPFVMRLVGLPGEKIHIEDGSLWIDGDRQTVPKFLNGLRYSSKQPGNNRPILSGSLENPALLGDNEYFVLGDFSDRSMDSRIWESNEPGRNPFAVPESHMKGVVTHTYWPPARWRTHR